MPIHRLTREAQVAYTELIRSERGPEIDSIVFPQLSGPSMAAELELNAYLHGASTMTIRKQGESTPVRVIESGSRTALTPPIHAQQIFIDEALRDSALAGVPETNVQQTLAARIEREIAGPAGFIESWLMARRKATVEYLRQGKVILPDSQGADWEYDLSRTATHNSSYNLGTSGNSIDALLAREIGKGRTAYMPTSETVFVFGANVLENFDNDSTVQDKRKATEARELIQSSMNPPRLQGVEGFNIVCQYRPNGVTQPVWITTYEPNQLYKSGPSATPEPYVAEDEVLWFNLRSGGYRFYRGIDVNVEGGGLQRVAQAMAIDSYIINDPPTEALRAQSRFFYIPANANHSGQVTCTF